MGEGTHPAQNPPPLEEADAMVLKFYGENATSFVQEFGLMESLIDDMGLTGIARRIFLSKLNAIHETILKMRNSELEKMRK